MSKALELGRKGRLLDEIDVRGGGIRFRMIEFYVLAVRGVYLEKAFCRDSSRVELHVSHFIFPPQQQKRQEY